MDSVEKLTMDELISVTGGESFSYRVGQLIAVVSDRADGYMTSYAANKAWQD